MHFCLWCISHSDSISIFSVSSHLIRFSCAWTTLSSAGQRSEKVSSLAKSPSIMWGTADSTAFQALGTLILERHSPDFRSSGSWIR